MSRIPNVTRKQGTYYFRKLVRIGSDPPFRFRASLKTTKRARALQWAPLLTLLCENHAAGVMTNFSGPGLTASQRMKIFRRQMELELDQLESLHADLLLDQDDLPDCDAGLDRSLKLRMGAIDAAARRAITYGETDDFRFIYIDPDVQDDEDLYLFSWSQIKETLDVEDAGEAASARLAELEIEASPKRVIIARKVVHEARIRAIKEFREALDNPGEAYPAVPLASYEFEGKPVNLAEARVESALPAPTGPWSRMTPTEAVEKFFEHNPRTGGVDGRARRKSGEPWTDKTREQFKLPALLLEQVMHGRPLSTVTHDDLVKLNNCFARLHGPSFRKSPQHRSMTIWQIVEETEKRVQLAEKAAAKFAKRKGKSDQPYTAPPRSLTRADLGLGLSTTNRHWGFLRQLTDWFNKHHSLSALDYSAFIESDTRDPRDQRDAYTEEQGRLLFSLPPWTGSASHSRRMEPGDLLVHSSWYFVPMISWYTGMRRDEICALRLDDIVEKDGYWQFECRPTEIRRLKTVTSARSVPFANELIRLGLTKYVQALRDAGETMLFPELVAESGKGTMGDAYYKTIWGKIAKGLPFLKPGQATHSFRHTVSTCMKGAGVPRDIRSDFLGHKLSSENEGRYSKVDMNLLREAVGVIPEVTSHLEPFPTTLLPDRLRGPRKARSARS